MTSRPPSRPSILCVGPAFNRQQRLMAPTNNEVPMLLWSKTREELALASAPADLQRVCKAREERDYRRVVAADGRMHPCNASGACVSGELAGED